MSALIMGELNVPGRLNNKQTPCTIEVLDNQSVPEVRIGPSDAAYQGWTASFTDRKQFEEFVEAVNRLQSRLEGIPRK